ncbi:MAG: hypothetical protein CMM38_03965 [Rhodospirillaceae bacterium]|nr:hypothetical protein [Rhodospirillaceae bacterium]|tara:strand:- start:79 stop:987 length:909 start_codon:yes stop_codon:yes gene_type:complete
MTEHLSKTFPEVGGILHLDHINFQVSDHDLATIFFIGGLGLTRDPFRRADETNMGVNVGLQQFHLPRRGATPPFPGLVGLIVPDLDIIRLRLTRLNKLQKFKDTPYKARFENNAANIVSPFGFRMRLHSSKSMPFLRPLGIGYIEIPVPSGVLEHIVKFYREVFHSITQIEKRNGSRTASVNVGPFQKLFFVEKKLASYELYNFHISFHITHYNTARDIIRERGALMGTGEGEVFFCDKIFNPENGDHIFSLTNEVRSVYHGDYMRPLINRWPIIQEPFSDQAEVMLDLERELGFMPGGKLS